MNQTLKFKTLVFAVSIFLFRIPGADAADWQKAYKKGDYTNAFQSLEKTALEFPDIGTYNRGNVLYRMKDFQGSEKAFASAAALTEDDKLKQKALYNRGTALLAGTTQQTTNDVATIAAQAAGLFEQALELKPDDLAAKQNFERAINLIVDSRIRTASQLITEADGMLTEYKAKTAKENYIKAGNILAPVLADYSPDSSEAADLVRHANEQLQMLEQAVKNTRAEMEQAKRAVEVYDYQTAADIMLDDKPERKLAFDLDEKLKQEFQQMVQNNQNVIDIIYPKNPLKP